MRPALRAAITAGSIVLVTAIALAVRSLTAYGVFTDVTPNFSGSCKAVATPDGPGDILIDAPSGLAFVSVTDRRARAAGKPSPRDGIYVFALKDSAPHLRKLAGTPSDFHPYGISLSRDSHGQVTLFAINRRASGENSIETFGVPAGAAKLDHLGSIESDELVDPESIAALDGERFYVTNTHATVSSFGRWLDDMLVLPRANILYFNGYTFRVVATALNTPRGVAASPDGNYLYVAEAYNRRLMAFSIGQLSGALQEAGNLAVPANLDHLAFDAKGHLWLAGQPKAFAMADYRADPLRPAPSEVFDVVLSAGLPQAATPVYVNAGGQIGGASTAAVSGDRLLIGSAYDRKILDCTMAQ